MDDLLLARPLDLETITSEAFSVFLFEAEP